MSQSLIIAHRGESQDAPENTLAAINLAWERKVSAVEIDIRLTKDNKIVVIHDRDTLRVSGVKKIIRSSTLKELKTLNVGFHKNKKWRNERIPELVDVLNTVPPNGKLIIEIKSTYTILNPLKEILSQSNLMNSQIELISFNIATLSNAKLLMPQYKMLWLLDLDYMWPWWLLRVNKSRIINKVKKHKLDGVDVWAGKILDRSFIDEIKNAGLCIYAWTVNNPEKASGLIDNQINGITTDRASRIIELLKKTDKH